MALTKEFIHNDIRYPSAYLKIDKIQIADFKKDGVKHYSVVLDYNIYQNASKNYSIKSNAIDFVADEEINLDYPNFYAKLKEKLSPDWLDC